MSSKKRQLPRKHYGLRKRARLGDITNTEFVQQSACSPVSNCFTDNQNVPENELPPKENDTSMFCSESVNFLPFRRKQPFPKRCVPELTAGGLFSSLPTEVLHKLFSLLDPESLLSLCLSSTVIVSYVRGYVYTPAGLARILPYPTTSIANTKEFYFLGEFKHYTCRA